MAASTMGMPFSIQALLRILRSEKFGRADRAICEVRSSSCTLLPVIRSSRASISTSGLIWRIVFFACRTLLVPIASSRISTCRFILETVSFP